MNIDFDSKGHRITMTTKIYESQDETQNNNYILGSRCKTNTMLLPYDSNKNNVILSISISNGVELFECNVIKTNIENIMCLNAFFQECINQMNGKKLSVIFNANTVSLIFFSNGMSQCSYTINKIN